MLTISLEGRVAVVTGASQGLGRAIAWSLAEAGAKLVLLGRRRDPLAALEAELHEQFSTETMTVLADITQEGQVERAAEKAVDRFGQVDILINSAGAYHPAPLLEASVKDAEQMLRTNVLGAFLCTRAFGAHMVAQRSGSIVQIAGTGGLEGRADQSMFAASKGAVVAFTKSLGAEWARHGVRVNAVAPGPFRTETTRALLDDVKLGPKIVAQIPLRRVGQPEEIGPLIAYLCSDHAEFVTGATWVIDGGQLLGSL